MNDCPSIQACPFFNDKMKGMPSTAEMYKKKYCHTDYVNCARFMVSKAIGKENVPIDLFPNQTDRVKQIINA